jgi:uncharacterized membrane protein YeaQ/YmgE (transglycosylase-associated protein family)
MVWPDPVSIAVFVLIVVLCLVGFVAGVVASSSAERRLRNGLMATVAVVAWAGATGAYVGAGFVPAEQPFPGVVPLLVASLVMSVSVALSPLGKQLAVGVSLFWIVGIQAFRLPLELVLHAWGEQGTIPVALTLMGQNYDIVVGVLALVVAPLARRHRWLVWVFEVVGLLMLVNILRIVFLNTPGTPFFVDHGQVPLVLAAYLPMAWIVTVCVAGAITGHLVLLRALLTKA